MSHIVHPNTPSKRKTSFQLDKNWEKMETVKNNENTNNQQQNNKAEKRKANKAKKRAVENENGNVVAANEDKMEGNA